ncbi:MAG TPA: polysaccharide biosynthesis C-terminal domain-containing protein [Flavisolibacter sp.]|nr:polysaccharide biosynthesis C-terminal domain-containing protein [Flavisolibacter sp.]
MSTIRRQSIISSVIVYFGFALGLLNTYLYTRQGGFTKAEYGLTNTFIAFASIMFSVASIGMPAYIGKFFPYYRSNLEPKQRDILSWALLLPCAGFLLVSVLGLLFKDVLVNRIFNNSPQLLEYYYWTFPFGFGYLLFMVMEAYAWQQRRAVLSNFLKEVVFRFMVTVLIVLTTLGVIRNFEGFIGIYAFLYLVLFLFLLLKLRQDGQLHLSLKISKVTRRFKRKIVTLVSFVWGGSLVYNVANVFDGIVIAAVVPDGMAQAGIFYLAQNISSLMQAPQRAVVSAAMGPLSEAWKRKDYGKINHIYHRSSINQLIFASAMFCLIWINFEDAISTFRIQGDFIAAKWVFFFIGLYRIIDMGTGLNAQIIGTSNFWRFEFISGLLLLGLSLPLNWALTRQLGIIGPAVSNLIAFTVYNLVRYIFLWRKFRMQPFTSKSLYTLLLTAGCYFVCVLLFEHYRGFVWIMIRSAVFCLLFATGMLMLKLSPDVQPVLATLKKRLGIGN